MQVSRCDQELLESNMFVTVSKDSCIGYSRGEEVSNVTREQIG